MKRHFIQILLAAAFLATANIVSAQTDGSYLRSLAAFTNANGGLESQKTMQVSNYTTMAMALLHNAVDQATAETLATRYLQNQYVSDMVELMMPTYKANISAAELDKLTAMYNTPAGRKAVKNSAIAMNHITAQIVQEMIAYVQSNGQKEVKLVDCPNSYRDAFEAYYANGEIRNTMEQISKTLVLQMNKSNETTNDHYVRLINHFIEDELENVMINAIYGIMSETDLLTLAKIMNSPEQAKVLKATKEIAGNVGSISNVILTRYEAWLGEQPEVK